MGAAVDTWALRLKADGPGLVAARNHERSQPARWVPAATLAAGEVGVSVMGRRRRRSLVAVSATGRRKNHDNSNPSSSGNGDSSDSKGDNSDGMKPSQDKSKPNDPTNKSNYKLSDWRDFRANLVFREQEQLVDPDAPTETVASNETVHWIGSKWAHPIPMPETGCVLVASEVLDSNDTFARTVVLLLGLGSRAPHDGPVGVILNRPLDTKMKHIESSITNPATNMDNCSLYFGGPVDVSLFLLRTAESMPIEGFEKIVPGVCFGYRSNLDKARDLIKKGVLRPHDFKFYVGCAGWDFDQLLHEIELGYWIVVACSSHLISSALAGDPSGLWHEILQLMGGEYLELSQKPKQDNL